jgi:integrase
VSLTYPAVLILEVVQQLGHESTRTTQDLYQHVPKDLARNVAIQVADVLDRAAGGSE